jgi:hypothetical protein
MPTGAAALGHDDDEGGSCSVLTLGGGASDPVVAFVAELIRAQVRLKQSVEGVVWIRKWAPCSTSGPWYHGSQLLYPRTTVRSPRKPNHCLSLTSV